jgi:crossover junction endodeoxyribonuclease RuvC
MRVIGIDQSYSGFAFCVDGDSKKKSYPLSKFYHEIDRLYVMRREFRAWLKEQVAQDKRNIDLIVMEGYSNASKFGREAMGELGGMVKLEIYEQWDVPLIVPPTSLKKFVTGKGNAKKNEMLLGVYKQWGVEFSDDNQADAYALEQFGIAYLDLNTSTGTHQSYYHKYQIEAVEAVRKAK